MEHILHLPDQMQHITLADGYVRGLLLTATNTVKEAARIHNTSAVATAALGRTLMATAFLGAMLKSDDATVTVSVNGGGPLGKIVCIGDTKSVRGTVDNPLVEMPLRSDGKLNVGMAVGKEGRLSVVKDYGLKSPYVGQIEMVSGEIAEDFASYYVISEQKPTLLSLGVLVSQETVLSAGGILLQPLPGCPDDVIEKLEMRSPMLGDISRELCYEPMWALVSRWLKDLNPVMLEQNEISYRCNCSRERMERALITLGREELTRMIEDEQEGAELHCHFCKKAELFTQSDLENLLKQGLQR